MPTPALPPLPTPRWISVRAYCRLYEVNRKTVGRWIAAGWMDAWQSGRILRVRHAPPTTSSAAQPTVRFGEPVVYFIQCERFIKIGCTLHLASRLVALEKSVPFPIRLIHTVRCGDTDNLLALERGFHARFHAHHHQGEWFRDEGLLREYLTHALHAE